jgi:hypothetical protein
MWRFVAVDSLHSLGWMLDFMAILLSCSLHIQIGYRVYGTVTASGYCSSGVKNGKGAMGNGGVYASLAAWRPPPVHPHYRD